MKRFDIYQRCDVENLKVDAFLAEIERVCRSYGLVLAHEDSYGAFIVERCTEGGLRWLNDALVGDCTPTAPAQQQSTFVPNLTPKA